MNTLISLFAAKDFLTQPYCLGEHNHLLWLYLLSNSIIVLAYYAIASYLVYFAQKQKQAAYRQLMKMLAVLIAYTGTSYLLALVSLWLPVYWLECVIKIAIGVFAMITVVKVIKISPLVLNFNNTRQLPKKNTLEQDFDKIIQLVNKIPGVIYQLCLHPDGSASMPFVSNGFNDNFQIIPKNIDNNPSNIFKNWQIEDNSKQIDHLFAEKNKLKLWTQAFRLSHHTQDDRWFLAHAEAEHKTDNTVVWHGLITDITQIKQQELELAGYKAIITSSDDAIISKSLTGVILSWNQGAENMFGYTAQEVIGKTMKILIPEDRQNEEAEILLRIALGERVEHFETVRKHKNGRLVNISATISPVLNNYGQIIGAAKIAKDITAQHHAARELRIAAAAFQTQEGMVITDSKNIILRVNKAFSKITGYSAEEAVGQKMNLLKSGRHDAAFYADMWQTINATGEWQGELWNRFKNGEVHPQWVSITAVKNDAGKIIDYIGTMTDITARKLAEEEIKHLAYYDPLTQLPNRRLLQDRLNQAMASSNRHQHFSALLFIDLDNFKTLNDSLGHDYGDMLLQQVAQRLSLCIRENDTLARLGGDEFVVLLEDMSMHATEAGQQAETVAEKIIVALNHVYLLGSHRYQSTPSIGITLFNDQSEPVEVLLKRADIAMYQAKTAGRNTLRFFDPNMQAMVTARAQLENDLQLALQQQQFKLFFQLQVENSHHAIGAEALIRWHHPERGLIEPSAFIPVAEETGLILLIGKWVLETACIQLKQWQQNQLTAKLVLSINVSAKQFHQVEFIQQVQSLIFKYGINPCLLKIELTESVLLKDINETIAIMNALQTLGVQFSLDDFGTGYSSLQYLKKLPLEQLKIDQSFVRDIAVDSSDQAIVRTIIAMAQALDINVIAEGVETDDQCLFLKQHGCSTCQGYLFGKPLPIEQFETLLLQMI